MTERLRKAAGALRRRTGFCHRCWRRSVASIECTARDSAGVVVGRYDAGVCTRHLDELLDEMTADEYEAEATLDNGTVIGWNGHGRPRGA